MKIKLIHVILFAILVLGMFLRLYRLPTNFVFGLDQSEDIYETQSIFNMVKSGNFKDLPIKGQAGTYLPEYDLPDLNYLVYTGVFYAYFLLPAGVLTSFSPYGMTLFFALLNSASILLIYLVGKELFDKKTAIVSALLFSVSYWMNIFSRAIWTPSMVPSFVLVSLYFMLRIKKGELRFWPFFLFSISSLSQIHDSGYYFLILFVVLIWVLKLKFPNTISKKIVSIILFLIPIFPTILYEVKTGFKLFPVILKVLLIQISEYYGTSNSQLPHLLPKIALDIIRRFWEFWISSVNPAQFNLYPKINFDYFSSISNGFLMILGTVSLLSLILFWRKNKVAGQIFLTFVITFFAIPFAMKKYYVDDAPGLTFGGSTFSLIGGVPFVILWASFCLTYFWDRSKKIRFLIALFLTVIVLNNLLVINHDIWQNQEQKYDYGDKIKLVKLIGRDADGRPYNLLFSDPFDEGFELVSLLTQEGFQKPVEFNGRGIVHTLMHKYELSSGESEISYLILAQADWKKADDSWVFMNQVGKFKVYKKDHH